MGSANELAKLAMGSPDTPDGPELRPVPRVAPPLISLLFSFLSNIDIFLNNSTFNTAQSEIYEL